MAEEFYLVKIGTIFLTDDGTVTGRPCLNQVEGLSGLFLAHVGSTEIAVDGTPNNFVRANQGKGVRLITRPFVGTLELLNDLKALIDAANTAGSAIQVQISDGPGAQNMDCDPLFENGIPPLNFGSNFFDTDLYDLEIRLVTRGYTA